MKVVANIQLKPTTEQASALLETLNRCNAACNWLSERAFNEKTTNKYDLHKLVYRECRNRFGLTAQATVRCIAKVADAYKVGPSGERRTFRSTAAQPYDDRIFRFVADDQVSIWTTAGRLKIPFVCGQHQRDLLKHRKGEVDLMQVRGKWYLACTCDISEPAEIEVEGVLGVDFGVVNLAYDSDGRQYSGAAVERIRSKLAKRKAGLQRRGTKAAKRRVKKLSGKEARFRKHTNHVISKEIVANAKRSSRAIAIEHLTHIRTRIEARRPQRARLHSWAFRQLRDFVSYKAKLVGIPLVAVSGMDTSTRCPECGWTADRNRKHRDTFSCISCGHDAPADYVGAKNIAFFATAAVTRPQVLAPT